MKKGFIITLLTVLMLTLVGCDGVTNTASDYEVNINQDGKVTVEVGSDMPDLTQVITVLREDETIDIDNSVFDVSSVDLSTVGTYDIDVTIVMEEETIFDDTITLEVVDTTSPTMTLNGDSEMSIYIGTDFTDPGVIISDVGDSDPLLTTTGTVDTTTLGDYEITYQAEDSSGNLSDTLTRTVTVVNVDTPLFTGVTDQSVEVNNDLPNLLTGVSATDYYDTDLTSEITVDTSTVDMTVIGDYTITYSVTDTFGNTATASMTLSVEDTTEPVLNNVPTTITLDTGSLPNFNDYDISATDNYDNDITADITFSGVADIYDTVGDYRVDVSVTDSSGNTTTQSITIHVVLSSIDWLQSLADKNAENYTEQDYLDFVTYFSETFILEEIGKDIDIPEEEYALLDEVAEKLLLHFWVDIDNYPHIKDDFFYHEGDFVYLDDTKEVLLSSKLSSSNTSITIPEGVTELYALSTIVFDQHQLTLPSTIEHIYTGAVYGYNLDHLILDFDTATMDEGAFVVFDVFNSITTTQNVNITAEAWVTANLPFTLHPEAVTYEDYVYHPETETLITYQGPGVSDYTVPTSINGDPISHVYDNAYQGVGLSGRLTIPDGIITIGKNAFRTNSLTDLVMANSVTDIGKYAFYGNALYQMTLSDQLSTIPEDAFGYNSLVDVDLSHVTVIEEDAFYNNAIKHLDLSQVEIIEERAFYGNELTSITLPSTLTSIGFEAFGYNNELTDVTLLGELTRFDDSWIEAGFKASTHPTAIISNGLYFVESTQTIIAYDWDYGPYVMLPDQINNIDVLHIGYHAFYDYTIAYLTLPSTLETIGENAFAYNALETLVIPDTVTTILEGAFRGNDLTDITIGSGVLEIGRDAFMSNPNTTITIHGDENRFNEDWLMIGFPIESQPNVVLYEGLYFNTTTQTILFYDMPDTFTELIIPSSINGIDVLHIGSYVFSYQNLGDVTISEGILTIGENAFYNSGITSLSLPSTLTDINQEAFRSVGITSLTLPSSLTTIGEQAFYNNNLTSLTVPEGVITIEERAFSRNPLTSVSIPTTVTDIGWHAFYDTDLTDTTFTVAGDTVFDLNFIGITSEDAPITVNGFVFDKSDGTITDYTGTETNIVIPETIDGVTVTRIGDYAFDTKGLVSVTLPSTITHLGYDAFENNALTSITLPEGLIEIGSWAFAYNDLTSITIPSTVTSIGGYAFYNNQISSVSWLTPLTNIPNALFAYNELTTFDFTDITSIGYSSFSSNNFVDLVISDSVYKISNQAFYNNNLLESITLQGDTTRFDTTWTAIGWDIALHPNVIYDSASGLYFNTVTQTVVTMDDSLEYSSVDLVIPATINGVDVLHIGEAFAKYNYFTSITLPEGLLSIDNSAFRSSYNLTSITIPSTVTTIQAGAFYGCDDLVSITIEGDANRFNDNWEHIGFAGNLHPTLIQTDTYIIDPLTGTIVDYIGTGVTDLVIPAQIEGHDITHIASEVFRNESFNSVTIAEGITTIGSYAFYNSNIGTLTLPSTIESINDYAFAYNNLATFTMPSSLTRIGDFAFRGNDITSLTYNTQIERIGEFAFSGNALTSATIKANILYGIAVFDGNLIDTVTIESGVTILPPMIFTDNVIDSVLLPDTLLIIGFNSFDTNQLNDITIPSSVIFIDDNAFTNNQFTTFTIEGDSTRFDDILEDIGLIVTP